MVRLGREDFVFVFRSLDIRRAIVYTSWGVVLDGVVFRRGFERGVRVLSKESFSE